MKRTLRKGTDGNTRPPYRMEFDPGTIKHLGLQMYSTLPPVIGELVSNAWDADATSVDIKIPTKPLTDKSEIIVIDNGIGMNDETVRSAYLIVGRDRREEDGTDETPKGRKVMGRKGIGKFSALGIAQEIEVETVSKGEVSRFIMSHEAIEASASKRALEMPPLSPTGAVKKGTRVVMRGITKFRTKSIPIAQVRRELARRFSIIGAEHGFRVLVNGKPITTSERDLQRLLERDAEGKPYLWIFDDEEIEPSTGWKVSGWIGALKHTKQLEDGIQRGIVIMARGKLVQSPFVFDAVVGQQFAFSYLVGEINAEFVDEGEDTINTARNSLVWDTPANAALKKWGMAKVNQITREWSAKRRQDNERRLAQNPLYKKFAKEAEQFDDKTTKRIADKLIRSVIADNPVGDERSQEQAVQMCLDFMQFNAFTELAKEVSEVEVKDVGRLLDLFREWEVVEAKEMMRVTEGRIKTIEKLAKLIHKNALEVPTLHNFLKEFPWVLDPRWTLVADEKRFSQLLRDEFPDEAEALESDRRIDFLCVRESSSLVVVEIKRPKSKASDKQLRQIETYVNFMRDYVQRTSDPEFRLKDVVGYLLCGDVVETGQVKGIRQNLEQARIFVRRYQDLLRLVEANHKEFLVRYAALRKAKARRPSIAENPK